MTGYWWAIGGLSSDIIGGSLLAVEAIKLENLRKLGEFVQERIELPMRPRPFRPTDPDSEVWKIPESELLARGFYGHTRLFNAAHNFFGLVVLGLVELITYQAAHFNIVAWLCRQILKLPLWGAIPVFAVAVFVLVELVARGIGEFVIHKVITGTIHVGLRLLTFVDKNTPTGTTGIIGFVFLFAGFLGQITAVVLNG